tara:strand:+ start:461 stop:832 length:372 start_codon:yes stop_codon:yes gene_type:complete
MKHEQQLIEVLENLKARDLVVLDVRTISSITDKMVIVTGSSNRQVKAMHDALLILSKQLEMPVIGVEGKESYEWVLMDFGDVVIHLMREEARKFYDLEKLWSTQMPNAEKSFEVHETSYSIDQ